MRKSQPIRTGLLCEETFGQFFSSAISHMSLFDLEEQYTFYASYHSNLVNKLVHIIFVPVILWSTLVFVSFTGVLLPKVQESLARVFPALTNTIPLNGSFLLAASYIFYYELLNAKAGVSNKTLVLYCFSDLLENKVPASILVAILLLLANLFVHSVPAHKAILLAVLLNVTGWVAQFIGHGVFESKYLLFSWYIL